MSPINLITIFIFFLGLFFGSFLNVLIDRIPRKENPFKGRSYCESCHKYLSPLDLIPILSFVALGGKCRYCRAKLSFYYPLTELITGILFAGTFIYVTGLHMPIFSFQFFTSLLYYLILFSGLFVIFFTDLKFGIIPDKVIFFLIFFVSIYLLIFQRELLLINLLMGFIIFSVFFLIALITKGKGMGGGDIKLSFLIGLTLGFPGSLIALYIGFLTGAVAGLILIIWRKRRLRETIPFGPFLVLGIFLTLFFQQFFVDKILKLLFP